MHKRKGGRVASNYNPSYVESFYDHDPEREWLRLVRSPLEEIKLHIHSHYLRTYLASGMRVLEIGAGPGRFTKVLHELGCSIVVGDISSQQLEANKAKAKELGFATSVDKWLKLDICDMAFLEDRSFDAVVAYGGPLSYVFERAGIAVSECSRVLKPKGLLLVSVMCLWGTIHRFFESVMDVPINKNREIVRTGNLTQETDPTTNHYCHMFRADELRSLVEGGGFRVAALSASNSLSTGYGDQLATIREDPTMWQALLEMELEACRSSGYIEAGTHLLVVAEKIEN
jgi:ubiquinone/menaquinone biosynthesis C-methylase UbiE